MRATRVAVVALSLALLGGGCAHEPDADSPTPGVAPAPSLALHFEPPMLELGHVVPGSLAVGVLELVADADARVVAIDSTCDCTTAGATTPFSMRKGERVRIPVRLDLTRLPQAGLPADGGAGPGIVERSLTIRLAGGTSDATARVRATVSDQVIFEPGWLAFGPRTAHSTPVRSVVVRPGPALESLEVLSLVPDTPALSVTMQPDPNGTRLDIAWKLDEIGPARAKLKIITDAPLDAEMDLLLEAEVEALLDVQPQEVENLAASLARPVVTKIHVGRRDGRPLEILEATTGNHRIRVTVEPGGGDRRRIALVIPVPELPDRIETDLTIRTDAQPEPLVIPIRVTAAPR